MSKKLTYKSAGVDISKGWKAVELIKKYVENTKRKEVLGEIGGFSGLFEIKKKKYKNPVLVSSTDGVGTKLIIAQKMNIHNTVGIDLVAMGVNDIIVCGAEPIFFLDYISCGKLNPKRIAEIVEGISAGCKEAGCSLIGGEMAEMPGMYKEDEYDLAGFAVGIIEKRKIIDGSKIKAGDKIIGLSSSGLHSNGYSLARKVFFEIANYNIFEKIEEFGKTLGEELLTPTKIYVKIVLNLVKRFEIKGIVNITGGGFLENIPRILPDKLFAVIIRNTWDVFPIFKMIQKIGNISEKEMFRTFNMGIGMVIIVDKKESLKIMRYLEKRETAYLIGEIREGKKGVILE
jgi:phosphoribosylformylglycinamidine cyclo-ligase